MCRGANINEFQYESYDERTQPYTQGMVVQYIHNQSGSEDGEVDPNWPNLQTPTNPFQSVPDSGRNERYFLNRFLMVPTTTFGLFRISGAPGGADREVHRL